MERWLILGLGQEVHKISLEHLVVPESKEVLKKKKKKIDGGMSMGHRS